MAENEEEVVVKSKGSNLVLILVIVLLLVILIIGSALIWIVSSQPSDNDEQPQVAQAQSQKAEQKPAEKKHESANFEVGTFYPLEAFTVNLAGGADVKYLKATMQLEQNIPELTPELDKKRPVIIDIVLSTLRSKSYEEISTNRGTNRLKEELMENINKVLNDGYIKNIRFTEFLIS